MFRRLLTFACLAYLVIAFGFIFLAMLNASVLNDTVFLAETDAQVIVVMSLIGFGVTLILALRMLIDSRYRRDLEQRALVPRRKSDIARQDVNAD